MREIGRSSKTHTRKKRKEVGQEKTKRKKGKKHSRKHEKSKEKAVVYHLGLRKEGRILRTYMFYINKFQLLEEKEIEE